MVRADEIENPDARDEQHVDEALVAVGDQSTEQLRAKEVVLRADHKPADFFALGCARAEHVALFGETVALGDAARVCDLARDSSRA